jgi:glycosyltransferase involved in cell wall biosynthesis
MALLACGGLAVMLLALQRVFSRAPRLGPPGGVEPGQGDPPARLPDTRLTVVVPAYNEADNIAELVKALLASQPPCRSWSLLVVDDDSTDGTAELAVQAAAGDPRFALLAAGPRPAGERWVGKNWACDRAWRHLQHQPSPPEWLLFVDADLRPAGDALPWALAAAINDGADLLSLAPQLRCGCLAEWLVQPIVASLLGLGFPIGQ